MEVCPLSRGVMLQPLSVPITGSAFAFSILLYPHSPSASLAVGFPAQSRREYGLTTFHVNQRCGLGSASPPAVLCPCIPTMEGDNRLHYHFGSGLSATLACSSLTTFISDSHYINHTAQPGSPAALLLAAYRVRLAAFALPLWGRATLSHHAPSRQSPAALVMLGYC